MIYPDVTTEEWLKKYPLLRVIKTTCSSCDKPLIADKPYRSKDYVGLRHDKCCPDNTRQCGSHMAVSKKEIAAWDAALGGG